MSGMRQGSAFPRSTISLEDTSVLRGTTSAVLLELSGSQLQTSPDKVAADARLAEENYMKSFRVESLDVFLSHSWHASWFQKYLTLLFYLNGLPAVTAGMLTGALCMTVARLWQQEGEEGSRIGMWTATALGSGAVLLVLRFWQDLRSVVGCMQQPSIFFDKVCIHQADTALKTLGIASIGGIIGHSKSLLIAWDRSYFSRLWCPFEIAAFRYAHAQGKVIVLPVELGGTVAWLSFAGFLKALAGRAVQHFFAEEATFLFQFCSLLLYLIFAAYVEFRLVSQFRQIECQLQTYSVRDAECFCCTNNHTHPDTGEPLPCDREQVYNSIAHWYGGGDREIGLDVFDRVVKDLCMDVIVNKLGRCGVPYLYVLAISVWRGVFVLVQCIGTVPNSICEDTKTLTMYTTEVLLLREPLVLALLFFISRQVRSAGMEERKVFKICRFWVTMLAAWIVHILLALISYCVIEVVQDRYVYAGWMCCEALVVRFFYFQKPGLRLQARCDQETEFQDMQANVA